MGLREGSRGERLRRALGAGRSRAVAGTRRILLDPRLRGEIGWVVLNKAGDFVLLFGLLKLLTNRLGKAGYGEYNLAEAAVILVSGLTVAPVHQAFLRDYHGSAQRGERGSAGSLLLRWYAVATLGVALLVAVTSGGLAARFEVARWTPLATGLLFLAERWRLLGLDVLNIERRRRAWAIYNLSYSACLIGAIAFAVHLGPATATTALFAYAATAGVFGVVISGPVVRDLLRDPGRGRSRLSGLVLAFGVPYAALLLFQWVQGFGDRYLVKILLDAESVGLYVAAYQVCGIPYMLVLRIANNLLTPIAYQRSRDAEDPVQLWAADRLLAAGIGFQLVLGSAMLLVYAALGPRLLVLLTNESFAMPATTLVVLAAARFAQSVGQATQLIFAVHHRLGTMLWYRSFGALLTFGICWWMIRELGVFGAALGTFVSLGAYLAMLAFGPRGCWWLVRDARRGAAEARRSGGGSPPGPPG